MGSCLSTSSSGSCATPDSFDLTTKLSMKKTQESKNIDRQLKESRKQSQKEIKILLLGPGESGKTTICKQMQIINNPDALNDSSREEHRKLVFVNLCECVELCFKIMREKGIKLEDETLMECLLSLVSDRPSVEPGRPYPHIFLQALSRFWVDKGLQKALEYHTQWAIPENMHYFFPDLDRLFGPEYIPTTQDMLHCRRKTLGISEIHFTSSNATYRVIDVGGQRSERKKWVHCFEGVTAILFLAAMSGYDLPLFEAQGTNQMQEALILFESIINSRWFTKTSVILFLNKSDILKQKISHSPLSQYFPDFEGDNTSYTSVREFFKQKFLRLDHSSNGDLYTHYTCGTDTSSIKIVMASVTNFVLNRDMGGFM